MIGRLKNGMRWQPVLVLLLVLSFVASSLGDMHVHVAHAGHAHSPHDVSAVHTVTAAIDDAAEHPTQTDYDSVPAEDVLGEPAHGCFVFLVSYQACHCSCLFNNSVRVTSEQRAAHRFDIRIYRPPKYLS